MSVARPASILNIFSTFVNAPGDFKNLPVNARVSCHNPFKNRDPRD